jgi:hypothetical protein
VYWATTGNYENIPSRTGSGIVAFPVRPGHFTIFVGVPAGTSTQRVDVITTLR